MLWVGPSFCACGSRVRASPERAHLIVRASTTAPDITRMRRAPAPTSDLRIISTSLLLCGVACSAEALNHYLSLGFSASRSQSPSRLTARASVASATPGNATIHHDPENRYLLPIWIMVPSDGSVGGRPTPRNDRVASLMIASARLMVAITSTGLR